MKINPEVARNVFLKFIARDGVIAVDIASQEFDFIGTFKSLDEYKAASRVGRYGRLSRKERISLYLTYENAFNHAQFEENGLIEDYTHAEIASYEAAHDRHEYLEGLRESEEEQYPEWDASEGCED